MRVSGTLVGDAKLGQPLALGIHTLKVVLVGQGQLKLSPPAVGENYGTCTERELLPPGEETPFLEAWQRWSLTSRLLLALSP